MLIRTLKLSYRCLLYLVLGLLPLFIALMLAVRFATPYFSDFRTEIEHALAEYLGAEVTVERFHLGWWGWHPSLKASGLSLDDPRNQAYSLRNLSAELVIAPLASLRTGRAQLVDLRLTGGDLTITLDRRGIRVHPTRHTSNPNRATGTTILDQLLRIDALQVRLERLTITAKDETLTLFDGRFDLRLVNYPHRHLDLQLADQSGARLTVRADIVGDTQTNPALRFAAHGEGWQFRPLANLIGDVDGRAWGRWSLSDGLRINGRLSANARQPHAETRGLFQSAERWELEFTSDLSLLQGKLQARAQQHTLHQSAFEIGFNPTTDHPSTRIIARELRVPESLAIASQLLADHYPKALRNTSASGVIEELVLHIPNGTTGSPKWRTRAKFRDVAFSPTMAFPGLSGLSGEVELDHQAGRLTLDSTHFRVAWSELGAPLIIDRLRGPLRWSHDDRHWQLSTPALELQSVDFAATLRGQIHASLPAQAQGPWFDLRLDLEDLPLNRIATYLPKRTKPRLRRWLSEGLLAGKVRSSSTVFAGHLGDFPFTAGNGLFESRLLVENAVLNYHNDWPVLEALSGEVVLENKSLIVNAFSGRLFGAPLAPAQASIENFADARLNVVGSVRAESQQLLEFTEVSPLRRNVGPMLKHLELDKSLELALELGIPLQRRSHPKRKPASVLGKINFDGNTLTIRNADLDLTDLRGQLTFTRDSLTSDGPLVVNLHGQRGRVDVSSDARSLYFDFAGRIDPGRLFDRQFANYIAGFSPWRARVSVPRSRSRPGFRVHASSDLAGSLVDLPATLKKTAATVRKISVTAQGSTNELNIELDYGPAVKSALRFTRENQWQLERGAVRIGAGNATLPNQSGLDIQANLGTVELASLRFSSGRSKSPPGLPSWLRQIDAQIAQLDLAGRSLVDTSISLRPQRIDQSSELHLVGPDIDGHISIPDRPSDLRPLLINLNHFNWRTPDSASVSDRSLTGFEPSNIAPLVLSINDLRRDNVSIGRLRASTELTADGMRLANLSLDGQTFELNANGNWIDRRDGASSSKLTATLSATELADPLSLFGYTVSIGTAPTQAHFEAQWSGPLLTPSLDILQGHLRLSTQEGRLLQLEPGIGRFAGLFNLTELARRLRLDFSDFFGDGLAFNRIDSHLEFKKGIAVIRQFDLIGPAANIQISGTIDLHEQKVDQLVTITPSVGSSLAVAGAVAGSLAGGPALGAAVLVAGQMLTPELNSASTYQYRLTGGLTDPQIERVAAQQPSPAPTIELQERSAR